MRHRSSFVILFAILALAVACERAPVAPDQVERISETEFDEVQASPSVVDPIDPIDSPEISTGALVLAGGKFVVDDDGADCKKADFTSIQAAVDAAAADPGKNKIEICAGTYEEDVLIGAGNPVDLKGDGIGSTVITGAPGSSAPVIHVMGAGEVKIERLTVDGMLSRGSSSDVVYGIRIDDTAAKVKEIHVTGIMNAARSNQGVALALRSSGASSYKGKVEKSTFEEFSRVGIFVDGAGLDADVKHNTVLGPGETTSWAPNGIQISRGATAKVEHNVVRDADHTCECASGIILFEAAAGVDVKHNDVSNSDIGIGPFFNDSPNKISHNKVRDSDSDGIRASVSDDSEITHNEVWRSGDDGVQASSGSTGQLIKHNRVSDSADDGLVATGSTSGNLFEHNRATGSGDLSCNDTSSGGGTAGTANTWKKNNGESPSSPPEIC